VAALYTFGCPRVATGDFAQNLRGLHQARLVLEDDLVAKLPPAFSLPFFPVYQHLGGLIRLDARGTIEQRAEAAEVADFKAGLTETADLLRRLLTLPNLAAFGPPAKPLGDHTPRRYTQALRAALARGV
jgi:hypothetical protein